MLLIVLLKMYASFVVLGFIEASENPLRCNVGDSECERIMYNGVLEKYASGIPDLGILSVDPMELKDISVSILGAVNLTLISGVGRGVQKCKFVELTTFIEEIEKVKIHKECDLTVEGRFKISTTDPNVQELLEVETIDAEGNGILELSGLTMFLEFPYAFYRHDDGEIYLKSYYKDIKYTKYELNETRFIANDLIFNSQEANNIIVKFLNENSSFIMTGISREIIKKVMEFYRTFCDKFFQTYPAKLFFKSDLEALVKN